MSETPTERASRWSQDLDPVSSFDMDKDTILLIKTQVHDGDEKEE